jgi:hypothetical protein
LIADSGGHTGKMAASRVWLAALNNALWYEALFRAHGVPGGLLGSVWLSRHAAPPFHSNLVVVSEQASDSEVLGHVHDLMQEPLSPQWTVKDSFCRLNLAPLGFGVMFEASWIGLESGKPAARAVLPGTRWTRVSSPAEAAGWEAAWRGHGNNQEAHDGGRPQFPGELFVDPGFAFFARSQGRSVIAGGIAHRAGGVVGLSNVFVHAGEPADAWAGLLRCTGDAFPGLPVVGYERGDDLESAIAVGFEPIGPLRVWQRRGRNAGAQRAFCGARDRR